MSEATNSSRNHLSNNLDLMRLAFAALVLLAHSFELVDGDRSREPLSRLFNTLSFGELAVDFFFVLSGFLITMSWSNDPRCGAFLRKRILRIYPGFIVAFSVSVVIAGSIGAADIRVYLGSLNVPHLVREMILLTMPTTPPTFTGWQYASVNSALWTIHYEFLCYLLVLVLGLSGFLKKAWPIVLLWAGTLVLFFLFRYHQAGNLTTGSVMGGQVVNLLRFVPLFLSGAVIYKNNIHKYRPTWLIAAALVLLIAGMNNIATAEVTVATAGAFLLFVVGFLPLRYSNFGKIPDVSYGVYLYGWPIQRILVSSKMTTNPISIFVLSLVLGIGLGLLSWWAIEKPAQRFRNARMSLPRWFESRRLSVLKGVFRRVEFPICFACGSPVTDHGPLPAPYRPVPAEPDNAAETVRLRADSSGRFGPAVARIPFPGE
jgi:peptidoglycan/LPS O-acetylase OafA/YrhL